jgi:hypothetical protein
MSTTNTTPYHGVDSAGIDYRHKKSGHGYRIVLLRCPACGIPFITEEGESNNERPPHFLEEHTPDDFGLSPLREDDS